MADSDDSVAKDHAARADPHKGKDKDESAQLNEQIAEGHEHAAEASPGTGDIHDVAAEKHRQTGAHKRSEARSARDERR